MRESDLQKQLSRVFIVTVNNANLEEISDKELSLRKLKRPHNKSRNGCLNCKRRRVKCDERSPLCSNCGKRGEKCDQPGNIAQTLARRETRPHPSQMAISPSTQYGAVNLFQMKLFHHFQTCTCKTFAFSQVFWAEAVKAATEFEFLMHAILCLSSRHLAYLCPTDPTYPPAAATHLSHTLRLFREALSEPFTESNMHPLMFTAALLYYESWSNLDFLTTETSSNCGYYDAKKDPLFSLASGMRQIFITGISQLCTSGLPGSIVNPQIMQCTIEDAIVKLHRDPGVYQSYFEECFDNTELFIENSLPQPSGQRGIARSTQHRPPCVLGTIQNPREAYMLAVPRLAQLLTLLPDGSSNLNESILDRFPDLLSAVSRIVFCFPLLLHSGLTLMLYQKDPRGLLLLYHFYRTAFRLLPERDCWWATRRAKELETHLEKMIWG